jgi:hypothetical protein
MRSRIVLVALVLALTGLVATGKASAHVPEEVRFRIHLTGAEEVPGPGDPDGKGLARIKLLPKEELVCWSIKVVDIKLPAIGAHIHQAPRGVAGPIVVPLSNPNELGLASGCASVDRSLIVAIAKAPSNFYVNVHTEDFPAGALRGQLA